MLLGFGACVLWSMNACGYACVWGQTTTPEDVHASTYNLYAAVCRWNWGPGPGRVGRETCRTASINQHMVGQLGRLVMVKQWLKHNVLRLCLMPVCGVSRCESPCFMSRPGLSGGDPTDNCDKNESQRKRHAVACAAQFGNKRLLRSRQSVWQS